MATGTGEIRYPLQPDYAVAPGVTLLETINALGIDQNELAERTGLTAKTISLIIHGKAPLTQQTAVRLERVTNVPARYWNALESNYREQLARIEARKELGKHTAWLKRIPTKELINRGALQSTTDDVKLLDEVLRFFGVASVDAWEEGWCRGQFAFRKAHQASTSDGKLASWLRLAEIEGQKRSVNKFNKEAFSKAVKAVRNLTTAPPEDFVPEATQRFADAGVVLCLVPEIAGGKISGAAKWLSPDKALIAVNLRGKKNDLFWFTLFHEAGHILNDSKKEIFIDISYSDDPREERANRFARTLLIPHVYDSELKTLTTRSKVLDFAKQLNLAPGIVVGRLQHDKLIGYSYLNDLKDTFQWAASSA